MLPLDTKEKEYIDSLAEENLQLLYTLGEIPSPTRHEDLRASFVRNWFEQQGARSVFTDGQKNTICEFNCREGAPVIIFASHIDIVFDDMEKLPLRTEGDRIYAPGIGDDTGNLVSLMMAYRYCRKFLENTPVGIVFAADACEEGLGNLDGTKEVFARYGSRVKAFVSFDGKRGQCCSKAVGSHRFRITIRVKGGHSFSDFGEPSAIKLAADLIEDLYSQTLPTEFKTTYNVGIISGGQTVNSIAPSAELLYEYRSESEQCLQTMRKSLDAILKSFTDRGIDLSCEVVGIRPGSGAVDPVLLKRLTDINAEVISDFYKGEIDFSARSTDSNIPLSLGIPANTVGTMVGGAAHTRGEWLDKTQQHSGMLLACSVIKNVISFFR